MQQIVITFLFSVICLAAQTISANAQQQTEHTSAKPADELSVLKKEIGEWNAAIKMWTPGSQEASKSTGSEVNKMVGDYWLVLQR